MGTHPIFESDFDCLTVFLETKMLARQMTLARYNGAVLKLASPINARLYTDKAQIPASNMFWMKHQIEAKKNFNQHLNMERWVSLAALVSVCGSVACPGYFVLDTVVATTFIAHGFWGCDAIIGDYVPLIAPVAVAKLLQTLWLMFCMIMTVCFVNYNLKVDAQTGKTGVGHTLRALINM